MDVLRVFAGVTGRSSSKSYSVKDETSNEIMAVIKLDNVTVAQTSWKLCSQQAWDQRFSIELDKSREVVHPSPLPPCSSFLRSSLILVAVTSQPNLT